MPIYSIQCPACGASSAVYRRVVERDHDLPAHCGAPMKRVLDKPYVAPEFQTYISPTTGREISSRDQRRDDLRRSGCIEWDAGARTAIARNRAAAVQETVTKIEAGVDRLVGDLHASGRL